MIVFIDCDAKYNDVETKQLQQTKKHEHNNNNNNKHGLYKNKCKQVTNEQMNTNI